MTDPRDGDPAVPAEQPATRREAAEARRREEAAATAEPVVAPLPVEIPPRPPLPASPVAEAQPVTEDHPTVTDPHDPAAVIQAQLKAARTEFESQVAHARDQFEEANERIKERTGRDLILAILIGVGIGLVLIATLVFFKWIFVVFALGASILGTMELTRAFRADGRRVDLVPQLVAGSFVVVSGAVLGFALHWVVLFAAIAIVIVWRLIGQMAARDGRVYGDVLRDVLTGVLLQLYVPFLTSLCLVLLRQDGGEWWVLAFIIVTASADTGAYATGLAFGRHPMAPRISPKKTWEGFAGAAAAALIAGVLLAAFMLHLEWWTGLVLGALVLGTATAGDLGESMLKRDLGIKDMSSWLPGHGGVLDRLDSILPSTVAALALFYLFTPLAAS